MDRSLDDVIADLGRVLEELNAAPDDAFDDRVRLRRRLSELRAEADRLRDSVFDGAGIEQIGRQLDHLYQRREELESVRPRAANSGVGGGGRGGGGIDPYLFHQLSQRIDRETGWEQLNARIHQLESRKRDLESRGRPPEDS